MGKVVRTKITCDVCGQRIHGDCMTVDIDDETFYVCRPRTAPINPCGNKAKRLLLNVFKKSDVAKALLEALDKAD